MTKRYAWHFCALKGGVPVLRDGRPVVIGEWLEHTGAVKICVAGLHASNWPRDAVRYAPGPYVTYCEVDAVVTEQADKFVCRKRKPIFGFDATEPLRLFARHQALSVAHLWKMPDIVRQYLETGEESIRVQARAAANAAANAANAANADADAAAAANADAAAAAAAYAYAYANAADAYAAAYAQKQIEANEDLELLLFAYAENMGILPESL